MQFFALATLLLASGATVFAAPAPAPETPYSQLAPSDRALVDATNLVCSQYPDRSWVMIGTQKVDCPSAATKREAHAHDGTAGYKREADEEKKRSDTNFNVDAAWIVEYGGAPHNLDK
ncbi:hypothetical protein GQ53DRAFT_851176 [Thozetella sp. PMI_491]|nr:hypothetical protein GQ53DRAFT_851176 [Thozetella sp. PMI_491]